MIYRIRSVLGRLIIAALLLAATVAASSIPEASSENRSDDGRSPRFVLVEEHHHVISHLVKFAREGYLRSHIDPPSEERNPNGAIVIHIDSHADMGLTPGLNHLPVASIFDNIPPEHTDEDFDLLEHSAINDFLLLLGYMGIVGHIIFVEPPWSQLFHHAHYTTADITMGVVPGVAAYASVRNSRSTIFSKEELSENALTALSAMMGDEDEPVEIIPHDELLRHCPEESEHCQLRTVQFTTLPYFGAAEIIRKILDTAENRDRDIVLDVDLDGFSTTSPGAQALFETTIPDHRTLTRIYHTVHNELCDMDKDYWERLKTRGSGFETEDDPYDCVSQDLSFVEGPGFRPPVDDDASSLAYRILSVRAKRIVSRLYVSKHLDYETSKALAEVFEYYLPAIDASVYDEEKKFVNMIDSFLLQPFFVPESETIDSILDFHFDYLFRTIFADGRHLPKVINVVRSPFYTPDHHLEFIECETFERLLEMFGNNSTSASSLLYHANEIHVDRTNCLHHENKFPHSNRINTGENPYETETWRYTDITYSLFFEDDDPSVGTDYKYDPIFIRFVNEHDHSLLVKKSNDGETVRLFRGDRLIDQEVRHLTRWELFRVATGEQKQPKASFLTIVFNAKHGDEQTYGSISGIMPNDGAGGWEL